jgi:hypothetical protein
MEKVGLLSVLVACLVFVLGGISSYLDKRSELRKRTGSQANVHQKRIVLMGGISPSSRSSLSGSPSNVSGIKSAASSNTRDQTVSLGQLETR